MYKLPSFAILHFHELYRQLKYNNRPGLTGDLPNINLINNVVTGFSLIPVTTRNIPYSSYRKVADGDMKKDAGNYV